MPHQRDLLKQFKESNLAKVNFLKLITKENPQIFSLGYNLATTRRRVHRNFVEKSMCKKSGLFDHQSYIEKSK